MEFLERYIDEEPTENYWRGIRCSDNGIHLFDIMYEPKKNKFDQKSHFWIKSVFFPDVFWKDNKMIRIPSLFKNDGSRRIFYDKEKAKETAIQAKKEYLNLLK